METGVLIYVWCPYCHEMHSCRQTGSIFECVTAGSTFTEKQSMDDLKDYYSKKK